ncbi:MAG TPA: low molecular weight phosphatase family protein [Candidatus Nanoarchaeia archaeon]|nr:low molecular weight phosphatase family protein [Candidatus Nanoarchaeia archaeon]
MKVLFICRANVGRSQMAEALFNKYSKNHKAKSAGTHVEEKEGHTIGEKETANFVCEVMNEEGIDVRKNKRKQLTPKMVEEANKVVIITDKKDWPDYLKKSDKVIYWNLQDAKDTDYDFHIKTRDWIKKRVRKLLKEIEQ